MGCIKSNLKCLKPWIQKFFSWQVFQAAWCFWKSLKTLRKLELSSPYKRKDLMQQQPGHPFRLFGKCMPNALNNKAAKTDKVFTLQHIFNEAWEYVTLTCTWFVDLVTRSLMKKFWRMLQEYGIDSSVIGCLSSHWIPTQKFVSVELITIFCCGWWTPTLLVCMLSPHFFMVCINWMDQGFPTFF